MTICNRIIVGIVGTLLFLAVAATGGLAQSAKVRIKDLVEFDGVRGNDLLGYGLVVGLNGTGDGFRNSPFTEETMSNILERLGVNVTGEKIRPKNVAAVFVTATLPAFARIGGQIDVTVSTIGDAKSLMGGTLILTPLNAADGQIYAVAQGSVIAGGASVEGQAGSITQGVPTSGAIPAGGRVEREIEFAFGAMVTMRLALRNPDFTTALKIERAINRETGKSIALMLDSGTVRIDLKKANFKSPAHLISRIENLKVSPEQKARVVVDQRSGTIVLGDDVRISRVAVSQGNLTLRVQESPLVVGPNPFSSTGETIVVPRTALSLDEGKGTGLAEISAETSLSELITGLNALGVSPRDLIDILKSIKAAGALHAEFIVR